GLLFPMRQRAPVRGKEMARLARRSPTQRLSQACREHEAAGAVRATAQRLDTLWGKETRAGLGAVDAWAQTALRRLGWTTRPPRLGRDWAGDGHVGSVASVAGDGAMLAAARALGGLALAGAEQASEAGRSARTRRRLRPLWLTDRQAVGAPRLRSARDRLRAPRRDRRRPGFRPVRAGTVTSWGRSAVAPARDLRGAARWRRSLLRRRSRALSARPGCACSPSSGFPAPAARSGCVSRLQAADARPCAGQSACPEAVPGASGQASAR